MGNSVSKWLVGDRHVASLVLVSGDFPWLHGRMEPGPDFALVAGYFGPGPAEGRWLADEALAAAGHPPSTWLLIDEDDDEPCYLHTLVLREADTVSWRFGLDPLDLD
ncbi:hypothetical protein [Longispora albida]|uniref:hypothetical protein n=1 Tax=Longispora albida TaxID=203523 RepID=UPI000361E82E|nr:hypothetical protein [Longispora albida]